MPTPFDPIHRPRLARHESGPRTISYLKDYHRGSFSRDSVVSSLGD